MAQGTLESAGVSMKQAAEIEKVLGSPCIISPIPEKYQELWTCFSRAGHPMEKQDTMDRDRFEDVRNDLAFLCDLDMGLPTCCKTHNKCSEMFGSCVFYLKVRA